MHLKQTISAHKIVSAISDNTTQKLLIQQYKMMHILETSDFSR